MDRIYTEAYISKSIENGSWEEDQYGNPIVIIDASNENLDYDEERVLRSALMNSKDYFLQNGVISYDHKHLLHGEDAKAYDADYNAEKYILGKPLETWLGTNSKGKPTVKVKAVLSKSNKIAQEIITKLKDGLETVKASVGGRRVRKAKIIDTETFQEIPTITGVDWDEVALTYKPVNQTLDPTVLCPAEFVKSLTAGSSANPAEMTGGNTLQMQKKRRIQSLISAMATGEVKKGVDVINFLSKAGCSKEEIRNLMKALIKTNYLGDVKMADENDRNDVEAEGASELEKALAEFENAENLSKSKKKDGTYVVKGGYSYLKKSDGTYEKEDDDAPDYNGDDDDMGKSISEDDELIDVTKDIERINKSIKALNEQSEQVNSMLKSILDAIGSQSGLMKSIGKAVADDQKMLKGISDAPQPRQTSNGKLEVQERFEKSKVDGIRNIDSASMMKSLVDAGVGAEVRAQCAVAHRRGGMAAVLNDIKSVAPIFLKDKE